MGEIKAKVKYFPEKEEWLGVVYEETVPGNAEQGRVLSVGVEKTEHEIEDWVQLAFANRPWEPDGEPAPDYYDRNELVAPSNALLH